MASQGWAESGQEHPVILRAKGLGSSRSPLPSEELSHLLSTPGLLLLSFVRLARYTRVELTFKTRFSWIRGMAQWIISSSDCLLPASHVNASCNGMCL